MIWGPEASGKAWNATKSNNTENTAFRILIQSQVCVIPSDAECSVASQTRWILDYLIVSSLRLLVFLATSYLPLPTIHVTIPRAGSLSHILF